MFIIPRYLISLNRPVIIRKREIKIVIKSFIAGNSREEYWERETDKFSQWRSGSPK